MGSRVSKKHQKNWKNRKRGFSKTELSFESGAQFERGGAKGRPRGAQGVHREPKGGPSKAQERLKGAKGGSPLGDSKETKGAPKGSPRASKSGPREKLEATQMEGNDPRGAKRGPNKNHKVKLQYYPINNTIQNAKLQYYPINNTIQKSVFWIFLEIAILPIK